ISFSSTTIEEALSNHVPVLQFGGSGRYAHIPCDLTEKIVGPVTCAKDKEALKKILIDLNENYSSFIVADELFAQHVFADDEVADFYEYFSKRKVSV
ncbi:MAG: hypothetical protein ABIJ26_03265, partial [Candidatus Margulisiibacteriota bacterium]